MSEHNTDKQDMKSSRRSGGGGGMGHGPMGNLSGAKAKDFKGTFKRLLSYLKEYRGRILVVILFSIGSAIFGIYGPKLLGKATTKVFEGVMGKIGGNTTGIDFEYISGIMLTLVILYGLSALLSYIQGFIMTGVSMKISYNMRKDISEKINKIPLKYFDSTNHG